MFENPDDYELFEQGDHVEITEVHKSLSEDRVIIKLEKNDGRRFEILAKPELAERQKKILLAGGLLKYTAIDK